MPILDIFSRRKKQAAQSAPDPYQYDDLPEPVRIQIVHIWNTAIGPYHVFTGDEWSTPTNNNDSWDYIRDGLCREKGFRSLANNRDAKLDCITFFESESNIDDVLDIIELSFRVIWQNSKNIQSHYLKNMGVTQFASDAIGELNFRLRQASVGYQFESGNLIRVDSAVIHSEVVLPALHLLSDRRFKGPNEEFLSAHSHYRAGEYKSCVTNAGNAFESTMKAICDARGWDYHKGATASDLLKVLRRNDLMPDYLDQSFEHLIATLKSGLPKVRNEEGAHGQGAQPKETPPHVAAYALHLAAAKIVFLVEAFKARS